ncbi:MAG: tandem-95 repeat protein [Candidatus Magnetomorum sp.]|nr:tandem-95 repeat protein [Candidatus Magnetomorum sp.]
MKSFHNKNNHVILVFLIIIGIMVYSQPIAADQFNQKFGFFSSGSGSGGNSLSTMSVVTGLAVSSEDIENKTFKQYTTSEYSLVNLINNAPVIISQSGFHLTDLNEDPVDNKGNSVSDILSSNHTYAIIDINLNAKKGLAITDANHLNGQWEYTLDNKTWYKIDGVSDETALLLAADSTSTRIRFVPELNHSGSDNGILTFRAWDQSKTLDNGSIADTRNNGTTYAYSEDHGTIGINIINVNDPPTAKAGESYTVNEGQTAYLDASQSYDIDDGIASYLWEQTSGLTVALSDKTSASPSFTVPEINAEGAFLAFKLSVSDHEGITAIDTVTIYINNVLKEFTITSSAEAGGTITPSAQSIVIEGSNQIYSIYPANTYQIADVIIDTISKGPKKSFTFWDVQANHTIVALFKEKPSISASADTNGQIVPQGQIYVNEGDFQLFKITPNDGFKIGDVLVNGLSVGPKTSYYFENVRGKNTIVASFKPARFSITVQGTENGTIQPENLVWVTEGKDQTFTITPSSGYEVVSVTIDGQSIGIINTYTFYNVIENHSIGAIFRKKPVIVSRWTGNGKIDPSGDISVKVGASQAFTIEPSTGFLVKNVLIDGNSFGQIKSYIFSNVQADHHIQAIFGQPIVQATAGENGTIDPSGDISIPSTTDQTFTIVPIKNYEIDTVLVDGLSIGPVSKHTLWNIVADHTIHVTFKPLPNYQITATANAGGTIRSDQGVSPLQIIKGGFAQFKITPVSGYEIENVLVDDISKGPITQYLFKNIQEAHKIQAVFKQIITYTITSTATIGGQISPTGSIVLEEGHYQLYTIAPADQYRLIDVIVDNASIGPVKSYAFSADKNHTIHALFEKIIIRSIQGQVTGEDIQTTDHPGLSGYWIEVRHNGAYLGGATSDVNGFYTLTGLPASEKLIVSAWPPVGSLDYRQMYYNQQPNNETADPVSTMNSDLKDIHFELPRNYQAGIYGRVHNGESPAKGIPNITVDVFSQNATFGKNTTTDEQGYYTIIGLKPESDYRVWVWSDTHNLEYYFALPKDQLPGGTVPTFSVFSYDQATPVTPSEPLLQSIDIIHNPNQGDTIQGQVFGSDGTPVEGIKVNAWSKGLETGNVSTTDQFGQYTISGLERVLAPDVEQNGYIVEIQPENYPYQAFDTVSDVKAATRIVTGRKNILFYLKEGLTISGWVKNSEDMPVSDVNVSIWSASDPNLKRAQTVSDQTGAYTLYNLPVAEDYILAAFPLTYPVQYYKQQKTDADATLLDLRYSDQNNLNFYLDKGHVIGGQVLVRLAKAPEGIPVNVWSENTKTGGVVFTDINGRFEITGLSETADDYIVSIYADDYPPAFYRDNGDSSSLNDTVYTWKLAQGISASLWSDSPDRTINLEPGTTLVGLIAYNNQAVSEARITVRGLETGSWGQTISTGNSIQNYTISGLAPDTYEVFVSSDIYADVETVITLTSDGRTMNIALKKPERSVSGTIIGLEEDTSIRLNAWSTSENSGKVILIKGNNDIQTYTISGLRAATDYRLEALSDDYPYQVYNTKNDWQSADLIDLSDHNQTQIDFTLERLEETATINGQVIFPNDAQMGDKVWIQVKSETVDVTKDVQIMFENAHTLDYTISGFLKADDYIAVARSDTFLNQYFNQADESDDATPIDMMDDIPDTAITFILHRGRSISGKILDETQAPVKNASVEVWSEKIQSGSFAMTTDTGVYNIAGLKQTNDFILWVRDPVRGVFYYAGPKSVRDASSAHSINTIPKDQNDINIWVSQTYSIRGQITGEDGKILGGVWVDAKSIATKKGGGAYSLDDGTYQISGLAFGNDYQVTVSPERPYIGQTKEKVAAGAKRINFILKSLTGVQLSGIIYASNGTPLKGAKIEIQSATDKNKYALVQSSKLGAYLIENLPEASDYMISVWPLENSSDAFYSEKNIVLSGDTIKNISLRPALKIGGIVNNRNGTALKDIQVTVYSQKANYWKEIKTDKNGKYELNNVPEATDYVLTASSNNYIKQEKVGQSPGLSIHFTLEQSGMISGYVRDKSSGIGLANVSVEVFSESMKGGDGFGGVANTDDNGFFSVLELKPTDQQGKQLKDYVITVYSINYPSQSKGGRSVGDTSEFLLSKNTANDLKGKVADAIGDTVLIDLFDTKNDFLKTLQADTSGNFTASGLSADKSYQLRFLSKNTFKEQWAGADGTGKLDQKDAATFKTGDTVSFAFSSTTTRKRYYSNYLQLGMTSNLGPVENLRSTSHPYIKISRLRATTETTGQLSNNPNITIQWEPPENASDNVSGYYNSFNTSASTTFNKFNTVEKPPLRTRKITSRDLEGDDVSYYFHVSPVDKDGRIGQTTSIAFRIDTVPPTNVSVIPPIYTNNRSVDLVLGATGASEMYISNVSYSEGGAWELRSKNRTWQLPEGSGTKKVYVRYRDKANNVADASATTIYEIPVVIYAIDASFGDHGRVAPEGRTDVEAGKSQPFTFIPDDGYRVDRILIDNKAVNLNTLTYTFENVQASHTLQVQYKRITHRISITVGDNGSVSPGDSVIEIPLNDNQQLTVLPDQGYGVDQVLVDGKTVSLMDNTYPFNSVVEDHTFIVTFEKIVTITATGGDHGNVKPSGNIPVSEGGFQTIQMIPDPGYEVDTIYINDTPTTVNGNVYTFMDVRSNQSIRATFRLTQFTITAIASANGSIDPKGDVQVTGGENQQFTFTPASGYELDTVLIDDRPIEIVGLQYVFETVTENHIIAVSFSRINTPPVAKNSSVYTDEDIKTTGFMGATDIDGDSLTYQVTIPGKMGRVHVTDATTGAFLYTPNPNIYGTDSFSFTASDSKKTSNAGTVFVHIKAINDPPTAYNQSVETAISTPVSITLKASDMDGDPLQFNIVKTPERGMLSGQAPYLVYMPIVEDRAVDAFYFVVSDTKANSYTATVSIIIGDPDANVVTDEDTPITLTLDALDPDEPYTITTTPQFGNITITETTVIYTPDLNFNGYDQFDYFAKTMNSPKTVKIYVRPVNDAPMINMPSSLTMLEDSTVAITVDITDIENDPLNITIEPPPNGQVTGEIPHLTYIPVQGFKGLDAFTIQAMDGYESSEKTIYITVEPKNIAPEAFNATHETLEDKTLTAMLNASDSNNDSLYYLLTSNASKGQVTIEDPNTGAFTYHPRANVNGVDTFMFKAYDGILDSNIATITIDIQAVNDPPVAVDGSIVLFEDQYAAGTLQGVDIDGYPLQFEIFKQGTLGTASITNPATGAFVFSPAKDQFGTDRFEFKVIDGENMAYTAIATIDIYITPVNDAPQAYGDEAITDENTSVSVHLKATDIDNDINSIQYQLVQSPHDGDATIILNTLEYTPSPGFWGQDQVIYRAFDGELHSNLATVKIWVGVSKADLFTLEDQAVAFTLPVPDHQSADSLLFNIVTPPGHGTLSGVAPDLTYTPSDNFNGDDQLTYTINDGPSLTLKIYVKPVNDTPVIAEPDKNYLLLEDMPLSLTLNAYDVDGDTLEYQLSASPMHGVLVTTDISNAFVYSPHANYYGLDQWIYQVSDGTEVAFGRIKIQVDAANDPPTANSLHVNAVEEVPIRITLSATDIDMDALTYEIMMLPKKGQLSQTSPYVYTPNVNYFGTDTFSFRVHDGQVHSEPAVVSINVQNINDPPVAISGTLKVEMGGMAYGRLIFNDPDNDVLVCSITKQAGKGMVVVSNPVSGDYIYFADANKTGADIFEFAVNDMKQTVVAQVQVTIKAPIVEYTELEVDVAGDYTNGDPYDFMLLLSDTGKIYREGVNNTALFRIPVEKGKYRLLIIGKYYQPYEYSHNDSKIISMTEDFQIQAHLTVDPLFDPLWPTVEVSHTYNENGFQLHVIRENFTRFVMKIVRSDGTEASVDQNTYTRRSTRNGTTDAPYIYSWTTDAPCTEIINGPGNADTTYRVTFKFYDAETPEIPVGSTTVVYVRYGSPESKDEHRTPDEKQFEDHYGAIKYLANAESVFYPLMGTTIHIMMKDINGNDVPATINIPPIPLDYLFVDESDNLKYNANTDTYDIDTTDQTMRQVAPNERLRVMVSNYTFGQDSLGTGVSIDLMINDSQVKVHYNPVLNSSGKRLSDLNNETPPAITLPILINSESLAYSSFMEKVTDTVGVKVNEKGDANQSFHTENIGCIYLSADHFLLLQTPHLSAIGLDIEKSSSAQQPTQPYSVESPGNCFIGVVGNTPFLGWALIILLIGGIINVFNRRLFLKRDNT